MKKFITVLLVVAIALTAVFCLAACNKTNEKTISICTPYLSSVTTKEMVNNMKSKLEKEGFKVIVNDSANDFAQYAADIETSVVSSVDAIILVSAAPDTIKPQIKEAHEAGIPIFGCDAGYIDEMQMNASSDNFQMGEMISKYLFDKLGKKGNIVHLTHRPHPGVVQRTLAMEEVLKLDEYKGIKLLAEHHVDVPNQIDNSKRLVEDVLTTFPEKGSVDAILCGWDEPAIGATQALQEAGRDEILVVGVDGNEQAVKLINEGTNLVATLKQDFNGMADVVVNEILKVFKGEQAEKGNKFVPAILIEKEAK